MKFVGRALVYRMQEAAIVSQFQCYIMFEAAIESRFESPPPLANRSFVVFVEKPMTLKDIRRADFETAIVSSLLRVRAFLNLGASAELHGSRSSIRDLSLRHPCSERRPFSKFEFWVAVTHAVSRGPLQGMTSFGSTRSSEPETTRAFDASDWQNS